MSSADDERKSVGEQRGEAVVHAKFLDGTHTAAAYKEGKC